MASATGSIEIDFGTGTGSNEASVAVTGQSSILAVDNAEAWMMAEASTDHTADDHKYAALFIGLTCSPPTAGVGFTIYARSTEKLLGRYKVRWVWASA
jgi:hypothetical protein